MPAPALNSEMPDFTLVEPAVGHLICSQDLQPRSPAIVVFYANQCPHCRAWEERLLQLARRYRDRVSMVMINSNDADQHPENGPEGIAERAREWVVPVPYLCDTDQSVARAHGAERTPDVFVFDDDRHLVYHGTIDDNESDPEQVQTSYLHDAVIAVLNGEQVPKSRTLLRGRGIKWKPENLPAAI